MIQIVKPAGAAMTQMSVPGGLAAPRHAGNCTGLQARSALARPLHDVGCAVAAWMFPLLTIGCVIPPSLSVDRKSVG